MQTAAPLVTSLMAASLLGGCASGSTAAGQANSNHPVVVVTTAQSATKRSSDKPAAPKIDQAKVAKESERLAGILGVLRGSGEGDVNDVFGGVVGGVGEAFGTGGLGVLYPTALFADQVCDQLPFASRSSGRSWKFCIAARSCGSDDSIDRLAVAKGIVLADIHCVICVASDTCPEFECISCRTDRPRPLSIPTIIGDCRGVRFAY